MFGLRQMIWTIAAMPLTAWAAPQFNQTTAVLTAGLADSQVVQRFEFKNAGPSPITLNQIKTSCGCTTTKLDKVTFVPGETGSIEATFLIGDRTGEQTKHIRVYWQEVDADQSARGGKQQVITLTMNVTIPEVLRISPRFLYWRPADSKTPKFADIAIEEGHTLSITGADTSTDDVTAEIEVVEAGRRYRLKVTPVVTDQPIRSVITVRTDNPTIAADKLTLHARLIPTRSAPVPDESAVSSVSR